MALMEPLTKEQEDAILADAGYTKQQLEADLKQIREWLDQQEHLPPSRLKEKDSFLKSYLLGCEGSLETVKRCLDAYYTIRSHSEIWKSRDPLETIYKKNNELWYCCILPKLSKKVDLVVTVVLADADTKNFHYPSIWKKIFNLIEMKMRMEDVLVGSVYMVADFGNLTAGHFLLVSPSIIKEGFYIAQNILPFKVKGVLAVNVPSALELTMNHLVRPLLTGHLKKLFHVFSSGNEDLHKFVDKNVLPEELGGVETITLKQLTESWDKKEISERDWFLSDISEHVDESKRVNLNNSILNDPDFGVAGSIKKLIVD